MQSVAASNVGGASVWGSESTGARNPPGTGESWRKSNVEVSWQRNAASYIDWLFDKNGYISTNNQGANNSGSYKENILSTVRNLEQNYPQYAVIDFDHGVGTSKNNAFHYMFEDNIGTMVGSVYPGSSDDSNAVHDYLLHGNATGKAFFAFINTCMSADYNNAHHGVNNTDCAISPNDAYSNITQGELPDGSARGMPYAWTNRIVSANPTGNQMSSDGYGAPDSGHNCYIGFEWGSAALDQTIDSSDYHYYYWIYHFFHYALECDYSIHAALDFASQDTFYYHPNFGASPLRTGFEAKWPMFYGGSWHTSDEFTNCKMSIFGNANLKLYQPLVTLAGCDDSNNMVSCSFTINGTTTNQANNRVVGGTYYVGVSNFGSYIFDHFSCNGANYYSNPAAMPLTSDTTVTAHFRSYCIVPIYSSGHGTVYPAGTNHWQNGYFGLNAWADSGYMFDHWSAMGSIAFDYAGSPTATAVVWGDGIITGVFVPRPANYHMVTLQYGDDWNVELSQAPVTLDGHNGYYMDYFGSTQYCLSEGWHELEIPQYVGWWSINSVYQDNNYIQGATADFWFYVGGSDTTIYCWYTF